MNSEQSSAWKELSEQGTENNTLIPLETKDQINTAINMFCKIDELVTKEMSQVASPIDSNLK